MTDWKLAAEREVRVAIGEYVIRDTLQRHQVEALTQELAEARARIAELERKANGNGTQS